MADDKTPTTATTTTSSALFRQLRNRAPSLYRLLGVLILIISGANLLFLITQAAICIGLGVIFFGPFILLSTPLWLPIAAFLIVLGFLFFSGLTITFALSSWLYRYFRRLEPPASAWLDRPSTMVRDSVRWVKDLGFKLGGSLRRKVNYAVGFN